MAAGTGGSNEMAMNLEKFGKTPTKTTMAKSDRAFGSPSCTYTAAPKPSSPGRGLADGRLQGTGTRAFGTAGRVK